MSSSESSGAPSIAITIYSAKVHKRHYNGEQMNTKHKFIQPYAPDTMDNTTMYSK
jgi:hypothetical protein